MSPARKIQEISRRIPAIAGVLLVSCALPAFTGCSIVARRPLQEMSDAAAAVKAAREVHADSNATDYFRLAEETYFKARQEYRLKNFARARKYADQARELAEKAEFVSIRGGAARSSLNAPADEVPSGPGGSANPNEAAPPEPSAEAAPPASAPSPAP